MVHPLPTSSCAGCVHRCLRETSGQSESGAQPAWLRTVEQEAVRGIRREAGLLLADLERDGLARRCGEGAAAEGYVLTPWGEHAVDPPARPDRLL